MPGFENFHMCTYNVSLEKEVVISLKNNEKLLSIIAKKLTKKDFF